MIKNVLLLGTGFLGCLAAGCAVQTGAVRLQQGVDTVEFSITGQVMSMNPSFPLNCKALQLEVEYTPTLVVRLVPDSAQGSESSCQYQIGRTENEIQNGKAKERALDARRFPDVIAYLAKAEKPVFPKVRMFVEGREIQETTVGGGLSASSETVNGVTRESKVILLWPMSVAR